MKKTLLVCMIVLLVGVSGAAFAATTVGYLEDSLTVGTAPFSLIVKTSKNVAMRIMVAPPVNTGDPAVNYTMSAYHKTGSRTFGTSNMDQKLYYQDVTGVTAPDATSSTTTPPTWTNWTAL